MLDLILVFCITKTKIYTRVAVQRTTNERNQIDLALSNFPLPPFLTYGLVWDPGTPGAGPKCFLASLSLEALRRRVLVPTA